MLQLCIAEHTHKRVIMFHVHIVIQSQKNSKDRLRYIPISRSVGRVLMMTICYLQYLLRQITLNKIIDGHNLTISNQKTKLIKFSDKQSIRGKVVFNSSPSLFSSLNCLVGCNVSYNYDLEKKMSMFQHICVTILTKFKKKV